MLLLFWKGEQRFALRGGQEFTAGHAAILMLNSVFGNCDRSNFRDSITSLILDRRRWADQTESLAYVNFHPRAAEGGQRTAWRLPNYQHLLRMVKNPTSAGAFAYGRTQSQTQVVEGRSRKHAGHRVAMENWQVLLKDRHPGYISWEQYLENQRIRGRKKLGSAPLNAIKGINHEY